jgi:hypothetical protein
LIEDVKRSLGIEKEKRMSLVAYKFLLHQLIFEGLCGNVLAFPAMIIEGLMPSNSLRAFLPIIGAVEFHLKVRDGFQVERGRASLRTTRGVAGLADGGGAFEAECALARTAASHDGRVDFKTDCALIVVQSLNVFDIVLGYDWNHVLIKCRVLKGINII